MTTQAEELFANENETPPPFGGLLEMLQTNSAVTDMFHSMASEYLTDEEQSGILSIITRLTDPETQDREPSLLEGEFSEAILDKDETDTDNMVEVLRESNDTLAAALGACPNCWDIEPENCDRCANGDGEIEPDDVLFADLIFPTIPHLRRSTRHELVRLLSEVRKDEIREREIAQAN